MENRVLSIGYLLQLFRIWVRMTPQEKKKFYDYKFSYYQFFMRVSLTGGCLVPILYLVSDYQLNGSVVPTLIPRFSTLLLLIVIWVIAPRVRSRRVLVFLDFAVAHLIVLSTIWAVYHLEIKDHFSEGSITMHLMFFTICLGASMTQGVVSYVVFFAEILLTNLFNHYPNLDTILSLNFPCTLAVLFAQFVLLLGALDQFHMKKELEITSITDELTQVGNRKMLDRIIENEQETIRWPACFVMLDVDHFKHVDDSYGHLVGDKVLNYLGSVLKREVGDRDYCIRYGGDEFILILNDCTVQEGRERMNELCRKVAEDENRPVKFTISIGVCKYEGNYEAALKAADDSLYMAKDLGRNQVFASDNSHS